MTFEQQLTTLLEETRAKITLQDTEKSDELDLNNISFGSLSKFQEINQRIKDNDKTQYQEVESQTEEEENDQHFQRSSFYKEAIAPSKDNNNITEMKKKMLPKKNFPRKFLDKY
ncbi:3822_t:CDS:2 [Ambispora gerdemannii]|uniref:3822_t:CDS:1 n=1 Tax=Ambispora gerdemannii TaxID=144530 RepID=A0A9N9GSH3_9GLOM|nr:3822_t:CDS:2 [Ambispora gerdemannii]